MNKVLLFGFGDKWGKHFISYLSKKGIQIDSVSSKELELPNVNNIKIDWFGLDRNKIKELIDPDTKYDLIFFNHNNGGAPSDHFLKPGNEIDLGQWNYNYWISCQLPYVVIHHLSNSITENTKIGWMLTGLIIGSDKSLYQYAGYAGVKSTNLHIMRGFSQFHRGIFFGLNPIWFPEEQWDKDAEQIFKVIDSLTTKDTGKSFNKDGSFWI